MRFIFLWLIIAANASIRCPFVTRHLVPANEETSVVPFDVSDTLEEVTKFVGKALLPNRTVGVRLVEVTILEDVTGDVVNNSVDKIERFGRGCCLGIAKDSVRVFQKWSCGGNISVRGKQSNGFEVNHGHQCLCYDQVDQMDTLLGAMLCVCAHWPGGMWDWSDGNIVILCNEGWLWGAIGCCVGAGDGSQCVMNQTGVGIPNVDRFFFDDFNGRRRWRGKWRQINGSREWWNFSKEETS